jgi:glycerol-3-phosphate dehydrogenase
MISITVSTTPGFSASAFRIRNFSALRPDPHCVDKTDELWVPSGRSLHDFPIYEENGLISLIGIKTPGLTCAAELGEMCAVFAAVQLGNPGRNPDFDPHRKAIPRVHDLDEASRAALVEKNPDYGEIICQCRDVTLGEIREAVRRGAVSPDGVKRRTGAGMGYCQGGRCMSRILDLLDLSGKEPHDLGNESRPLE